MHRRADTVKTLTLLPSLPTVLGFVVMDTSQYPVQPGSSSSVILSSLHTEMGASHNPSTSLIVTFFGGLVFFGSSPKSRTSTLNVPIPLYDRRMATYTTYHGPRGSFTGKDILPFPFGSVAIQPGRCLSSSSAYRTNFSIADPGTGISLSHREKTLATSFTTK